MIRTISLIEPLSEREFQTVYEESVSVLKGIINFFKDNENNIDPVKFTIFKGKTEIVEE